MTQPTNTYSQDMAQFVCDLDFDTIPDKTIAYAKLLMLDSFGVALSATHKESVKNSGPAIANMPYSDGQVRLWCHPTITTTVQLACLGNGIASHAVDFDDTHTESIVHGSSIFTPLVFGLGETLGKSSKDIITAFVAAWEIGARVGIASKSTFHRRGFHSTAIAGFFGAVAAACKLYDLNPEQTTNALGLCGSQAAGTIEFLTNSSSSKVMHVGQTAQGAITNANLAKNGFTGPTTIFEGVNSIFKTHGIVEDCDLSELSKGLGEVWQTSMVSIKPYPCCHFGHGFVDCALALRQDGITADKIQDIMCRVDTVPASFICDPMSDKYVPTSAYGAKFSMPFMMAIALIDGKLTQDSFDDTQLSRSDVQALSKKIRYTEDTSGTSGFPKYYPGYLVCTDTDGNKIEKHVPINRGNPDAPLSQDEVVEKFTQNTVNILSQDTLKAATTFFTQLEKQSNPSLSELLKP